MPFDNEINVLLRDAPATFEQKTGHWIATNLSSPRDLLMKLDNHIARRETAFRVVDEIIAPARGFLNNIGIQAKPHRIHLRLPQAPGAEAAGLALIKIGARRIEAKAGAYYTLPAPDRDAFPAFLEYLRKLNGTLVKPTTPSTKLPVAVSRHPGWLSTIHDNTVTIEATNLPMRDTILSALQPEWMPDGRATFRIDINGAEHIANTMARLTDYYTSCHVPPTSTKNGLDFRFVDLPALVTNPNLDQSRVVMAAAMLNRHLEDPKSAPLTGEFASQVAAFSTAIGTAVAQQIDAPAPTVGMRR